MSAFRKMGAWVGSFNVGSGVHAVETGFTLGGVILISLGVLCFAVMIYSLNQEIKFKKKYGSESRIDH